VTAFVLKYRVRPPTDAPQGRESFEAFVRRTQPAQQIAIADAKQALSLIRSHAAQFGVDPQKVGMIGFSAGAMTTMSLAASSEASGRPNLAIALYGALLTTDGPSPDGPPIFVLAARDDAQAPATKSVEIYDRWTAARLPAELHIFEHGGHGFAFRKQQMPVDNWPASLEAWLGSHRFLHDSPGGHNWH
jgi:predicted esterase